MDKKALKMLYPELLVDWNTNISLSVIVKKSKIALLIYNKLLRPQKAKEKPHKILAKSAELQPQNKQVWTPVTLMLSCGLIPLGTLHQQWVKYYHYFSSTNVGFGIK